jgi:hypothetical protein
MQDTTKGGDLETEVGAGFYADDGILTSTDSFCLQDNTYHIVGLFARFGLDSNTTKTKALLVLPGPRRGHLTEHAYTRMFTGIGPS